MCVAGSFRDICAVASRVQFALVATKEALLPMLFLGMSVLSEMCRAFEAGEEVEEAQLHVFNDFQQYVMCP